MSFVSYGGQMFLPSGEVVIPAAGSTVMKEPLLKTVTKIFKLKSERGNPQGPFFKAQEILADLPAPQPAIVLSAIDLLADGDTTESDTRSTVQNQGDFCSREILLFELVIQSSVKLELQFFHQPAPEQDAVKNALTNYPPSTQVPLWYGTPLNPELSDRGRGAQQLTPNFMANCVYCPEKSCYTISSGLCKLPILWNQKTTSGQDLNRVDFLTVMLPAAAPLLTEVGGEASVVMTINMIYHEGWSIKEKGALAPLMGLIPYYAHMEGVRIPIRSANIKTETDADYVLLNVRSGLIGNSIVGPLKKKLLSVLPEFSKGRPGVRSGVRTAHVVEPSEEGEEEEPKRKVPKGRPRRKNY